MCGKKRVSGAGVMTRAQRQRSQLTINSARYHQALALNSSRRRRRRQRQNTQQHVALAMRRRQRRQNAFPAAAAAAAAAAADSDSSVDEMSDSSSPPLEDIFNRRYMIDHSDKEKFPHVPKDVANPGFDKDHSNFFTLPFEVVVYLRTKPDLWKTDGRLDLIKVGRVLDDLAQHDGASNQSARISDARDNIPEFLHLVYEKMLSGQNGDKYPYIIEKQRRYVTRTQSGEKDYTFVIPAEDVIDLPIFLFLFVLKELSDKAKRNKRNFLVNFRLDLSDSENMTFETVKNESNRVVGVSNQSISLQSLADIYTAIIKKFAALFPGRFTDGTATWNGSEISGTRIMMRTADGSHLLFHVEMLLKPTRSVTFASAWTQEVEDLINEKLSGAVISVKNEDNKCLIYCLIMAMMIKLKESSNRIFGVGTSMVKPEEVYAKAMYMYADEYAITIAIRNLAKILFPPNYSVGDLSKTLVELAQDIDKRVGTTMSVEEFRQEFSKIEEKFIPDDICGVDIYGIDFGINTHLYPVYMSKRRDKTIELLCITPKDKTCSHFAVITNMEKLLHESGGKQFFTCSKCGECFYHRGLLNSHHCSVSHDSTLVPGDGGYHFSSINDDKDADVICGYCTKCRLCFTNDFTYEYHKEHCFMEGKTGYRHVQLVSYDPTIQPMLHGVDLDIESENKHVERRRMIYADFECSIDPDTGVHTFMSYGVYDWKSKIYKCGYDIQEFIDFVLTIAYGGIEDQVYVYFHNAMGYDANFILRHILSKTEYKNWGIQVIMKSMNRLQKLVFYTHQDSKNRAIHIGDTFLFLTLSLERIVASIRKEELETNMENFSHYFDVMKKIYPWVVDEDINHILRKNIFPYKFFIHSGRLDTPINDFLDIFVPREENLHFFGEKVSLEDLRDSYADTKHVIETFRCQTARDYHDLYLCCDVMQLADVFDRSMTILWNSHNIHLTRYLGMPSASWAAFLRHDPNMAIPLYEETFFAEFFKGMIRGGITSAATRYAKADDKHSIIYLDVNGLYPFVMQKYGFPCGRFEYKHCGWEGEQVYEELKKNFEMFEREGKGMCYCVDIHFPDAVKRKTDMYPFAPEHRRIYKEYYKNFETKEFTEFLQRWSKANGEESMNEFYGLVCTLYDKTKYNVHWRLLKFYIEHGVEIPKVWFGVVFDEGDYLAGYIRKNIEIRNSRKDELGKTLYKLLGNSIYGKTFESPFKRNTFEIVRDEVKLQGMLEEGNIAAMTPIDDLGWIVRMEGEEIILDKPTYIGACVCEFAKLHMYTLLYDKLMSIFPGDAEEPLGCEMIYTDTDSFIVRVKHPPGMQNTPEALFAYIKSCDPTLIGGIGGQVKSETGEDETIDEIIALRSKVYAYKTTKGHIGKRAKGTTHDAQEMQLDWMAYKGAYETLISLNTENTQFFRNTFKISSAQVLRQSLSVNDGKRYICADGTHTHAFGHPDINTYI